MLITENSLKSHPKSDIQQFKGIVMDGSGINNERDTRRCVCQRCHHPCSTCICEAIPDHPIELKKCELYVLQHPHEKKRKNGSLQLIQHCLTPIHVTVGRRLGLTDDIFNDEQCLIWIIFPGPDAIPFDEAFQQWTSEQQCNRHPVRLLFLDATWKHAAEMHRQSMFPSNVTRVQITTSSAGRFAECRTPPSPHHWSTAECMAHVVSRMEGRPDLWDTVLKPIDLMAQQWRSFRLNGSNRTDEGEQEKDHGE